MLVVRLNSFPIVSGCFQTLKERGHCRFLEMELLFTLYNFDPDCYMHIALRGYISMLKHHRSSLGRLAAGTPKEKAGLVRCLLVSMETARRSGQTMQDVWHTLEVPGLSLRYHV